MIPVKISDHQRRKMINNVVRAWREATPEQREAGRSWYWRAHELAGDLAHGDTQMGAGVIAALSANKSWRENVKIATRAFEQGRATGHVRTQCAKADAIMDGVDPVAVLPMGRKTGHFYRCIADPANAWAVCIDRHAHDIAVGEIYGDRERGLSAGGRYNALCDVYRAAARQLGELPQVVQAGTWVSHTAKIAGTSTRTNEHK